MTRSASTAVAIAKITACGQRPRRFSTARIAAAGAGRPGARRTPGGARGPPADDGPVRGVVLCRVLVDRTNRHGARPEAPCNRDYKILVVADNQSVELRHRLPPSAGAINARNAWRAQSDTPLPPLAADRTPRRSPAAAAAAAQPDAWPPPPAASPPRCALLG